MFRECKEYQNKSKRKPLFGINRGTVIETTDEFKYDKQVAILIDKQAIPAGFEEMHLVKIRYEFNGEEEILDCTHNDYFVLVIG